MKVTKDMIDSELRPYWSQLKAITFLLERKWGMRLLLRISRLTNGKAIEGLDCDEHFVPSTSGGPPIRVRVFAPAGHTEPLPVLLYLHGGGYAIGNPEMSLDLIERFIETRPCVVVAPDYRKSLTAPFPAGFNDCYDTLLWAKANAEMLGARSDKFIIAGHSAGGGLAAALTLKARDTKEVEVAFQMPIYPMIDDRQTSESARDIDSPVWNTKTNNLAWDLYLSGLKESGSSVPAYAAAARNDDYAGFPPTITFVGDLEPFRDETMAYVDALTEQGVDVAFKLFRGGIHGFDVLAMKTAGISQEAIEFTFQKFAEFYDAYAR